LIAITNSFLENLRPWMIILRWIILQFKKRVA
jgi:hypothetical protein